MVSHCLKALSIDEKSTKALFRRAQAYLKKSRFDDAEQDLKTAHELASEDKVIASEYGKAKKLAREHNKAVERKFAGMFDRDTEKH